MGCITVSVDPTEGGEGGREEGTEGKRVSERVVMDIGKRR